jgi:PAS domain S-box-containing protein
MLQAVLTIIFVGHSVEQAQSENGWRELSVEGLTVFDNFNAWKRALWKQVVDLNSNKELKTTIHSQTSISLNENLISLLMRLGSQTGAEWMIIKSSGSSYSKLLILRENNLSSPDERFFTCRKDHPYIEMVLLSGTLYFTGTVRVKADDKYLDIFLLKQVDENLCRQLTFNPRVKCLASVGESFSIGTLKSDKLFAWLNSNKLFSAYEMIPELEQDGVPFSVLVQKSGLVRVIDVRNMVEHEDTLYLSVFLSRSEFREQLSSINTAILSLTLFIAFGTIVISFILTDTITLPIRQLRDSMVKIKSGERDVMVQNASKGEIGELLQGFNEMAKKLLEDNAALDAYIAEIVRISEYNDKIFNSIRESIVVINSQFTVEKVNYSFAEYFSISPDSVIGKRVEDLSIELFDEAVKQGIRKILHNEMPFNSQTHRTPSGQTYDIKFYPLREASKPETERLHCIVVIEDVGEKIAYEEKIFLAEKLANTSMLSAGVAHEINNPLSSILTNVQNLIADETKSDTLAELKLIEQEAKRIARIIRKLLDFSSFRGSEDRGVQINAAITETVQLIRYAVKNSGKIKIETDLQENLPLALIGEDELKQILINLIKNSLQALDGEGTISIQTHFIPEKGSIEMIVEDTGPGIRPEILSRIFDPFFTTKVENGNTGLGLSVVYGLVTKYQGTIFAESTPGRGTRMRVTVPAAMG